jgi:diguanylate cyclase (GGDEF)-like protein
MSLLGIFTSFADPAFVADVEGRLVETNAAFSRLIGSAESESPISEIWPEIEEFWKPALEAVSKGTQPLVDIAIESETRTSRIYEVRFQVVGEDGSQGMHVIGVARDVTADRARMSDLTLRATSDPLTGVFNRAQIEVLIIQTIRVSRRRKSMSCFVFLDVDNFKKINDTYGHSEGDRALKEVVAVLRNNLRESDVIGRFGGDEFGVILTDSDPESGALKAQQLSSALSEIELARGGEKLAVSMGVTAFPANGDNASDVIKRADAAMYRAKRSQFGDAGIGTSD